MNKLPSHLSPRAILGNTIDLNRLRTSTRAISCEALAYHRPNVRILEKLEALYEDVGGYIKEQTEAAQKLIKRTFTYNKAAKVLKQHPYSEFIDIPVPIIPGQTGTWHEVSTLMLVHMEYVARLEKDLFAPLNKYLGTVLNKPEHMGSAANRPVVPSTAELEELTANYKKLIGNGTNDTARFGAVFRRNADWGMVIDDMNKINAIAVVVTPEHIKSLVDETNGQLTRLLKDAQDPNKPYRPTAASIDYLTKMIQRLAEEVTLYAALCNYVNVTNQSLLATEKILASKF